MNNSMQPPLVQAEARIKELKAVLKDLLFCAELSQDDLEPETVRSIQGALDALKDN